MDKDAILIFECESLDGKLERVIGLLVLSVC